MSTKKLTLQTEKHQRASNEIMVMAARPVNDFIYPDRVTLANGKYIVFQSTTSGNDAYITRDGSNNLIVSNLINGGDIVLVATMASSNQRNLTLRELGSTNELEVNFGYTTNVVTDNGDLILSPAVATETTTGRKVKTTRVTTTYTILVTDDNVFCDSDSGAFTVTLPAGVDGQKFRIINTGSSGNIITISPNGSELLEGANATRSITDGDVIILVYETTEGWW